MCVYIHTYTHTHFLPYIISFSSFFFEDYNSTNFELECSDEPHFTMEEKMRFFFSCDDISTAIKNTST